MNLRDEVALKRAQERFDRAKQAARRRWAEDLADLNRRGNSLQELGRALGRTRQAVSQTIERGGVAREHPAKARQAQGLRHDGGRS